MEWLKNSVDIERTIFGKASARTSSGESGSGGMVSGQLEINFVQDFEGL